jgi:hypothetical protein
MPARPLAHACASFRAIGPAGYPHASEPWWQWQGGPFARACAAPAASGSANALLPKPPNILAEVCRWGTLFGTLWRSGTPLEPPVPCSAPAGSPAERRHRVSGACGRTSYRSHPSFCLSLAHGLRVLPASCGESPGCAAAAACPNETIDPRSSVGARLPPGQGAGPDERRTLCISD